MRLLRVSTLLSIFLFIAAMPAQAADGGAKRFCSGAALVSKTFANGAEWSFCWELRAHEGLRINYAFYKPVGGQERQVLHRASLGELFVAYAPGGPRYTDVFEGLGAFILPLTAADCPATAPPGERRLLHATRPGSVEHEPLVCQEFGDRGIGIKFSPVSAEDPQAFVRRGQELAIWSSHQIGQYNYLIRWTFHDDGSFRPEVGATGRQQIVDVPHTHTAFWRLDFDIDGGDADTVDTFTSTLNSEDGSRQSQWTAIPHEQQMSLEANTFRTWRVRSARVNAADKPLSYELVPLSEGVMRGPTSEPFTQADVWITRARKCEMYAIRNREAQDIQGCRDNVAEYVADGEAVEETDVVLWYAGHIHHQPRTEEAQYMPVHWIEALVQPRDFLDSTP
jgi:Cu2+-containing amine oxidase